MCLPRPKPQPLQAGLDEGFAQLARHPGSIDGDPADVENRLIVLTDAEANCGDISEGGLLARIKAAAADRLYTTIVGARAEHVGACGCGCVRVCVFLWGVVGAVAWGAQVLSPTELL
jgi:hypothetical protein